MNIASDPSQGLRKAALAVHALAPVDRAWVLGSLPPRHRQELEPLLVELEALGIPQDASLHSDLEAASTPAIAWPETLDANTVSALARVLAHEPERLTHLLLSLRVWSWSQQLLLLLDAERRDALSQSACTRPVPPRLASALLEALRKQAMEGRHEAHVPASATPRPWRWLRTVLVPVGRRA